MPYTGSKVEKEIEGGGKRPEPGKYKFKVREFAEGTTKKGDTFFKYKLTIFGPTHPNGFDMKNTLFFFVAKERDQKNLDSFLTVIGCTKDGNPFFGDASEVVDKHGVVLLQHQERLDENDHTKIWMDLIPLKWNTAWFNDNEFSAKEMNTGGEAKTIVKNMDECEQVDELWGQEREAYEAASGRAPAPEPTSPKPQEENSGGEDLPF